MYPKVYTESATKTLFFYQDRRESRGRRIPKKMHELKRKNYNVEMMQKRTPGSSTGMKINNVVFQDGEILQGVGDILTSITSSGGWK
jgi:hypothetical protein